MLYGTLVQTRQHPGGGFDKLSPNGSFFTRWILSPFGLSSFPFGLSSPPFGLSSPPFGLSLSKPSRGPAQP